MRENSAKCFAKLNLAMDIISKRPDGYHCIRTVMQSISLADRLDIALTDSGRMNISITGDPEVPSDQTNIAARAADEFFRATGINFTGIDIRIDKKIPAKAGLGGGSSNAAGVLVALDRLYNTRLSEAELINIALRLGSDVPFFIAGGCALVEGIGERITRLQNLPELVFLVVKPDCSMKTDQAYKQYDQATGRIICPDIDALVYGIEKGDSQIICSNILNVFEQVIACKQINEIKEIMRAYNPLASSMTGSGTAVFAVFSDSDDARRAYSDLSEKYSLCFICNGEKTGVKLLT